VSDKKYYWLKLKNDFFDRKDIKLIENMENGKDYIIFLLKLKLRSLEEEGFLRVSDTMPYNEKMLSTITNTDIDIVRTAMKVFIEFGLIEIMEDHTIFMKCIEKLIGSETSTAERMRKFRENRRLKALNEGQCNNVTPRLQNSYTEIEIDKEKEIEYKKEPQTVRVCTIKKRGGTCLTWCKQMVNRYCPEKDEDQCWKWLNEYRKWIAVYVVKKGFTTAEGVRGYMETKPFFPIFTNQLKDYMERDPGGMADKIRAYRNRPIER
jgi:predicted phage replisome organizer